MRRLSALAVGRALIALLPPAAGAAPGPVAPVAPVATAAPFTVERLLALEQLESARLDPSGRWLVVQRYARWDSAPAYDLDWSARLGLGRIQVFDVKAGGAERRLDLPGGPGYVALGVSPGGRRLAVGRLTGHAFELGVVELATGQARWLGIAPRQPVWGPSLLWRTDDQLLVSARPQDAPDTPIGFGWQGQARVSGQWTATARGELGASVVGSGRYRDLRARAASLGLMLIDLKTGQSRVVVPGAVRDFSLAPDGATAAALVEGQDIQPQTPEPTNAASEPTAKTLVLAGLDDGGPVTPCPDCDVMGRFLSWSDDGRALLVFARRGDVPFSEGAYWRMSLRGAAPLALGGLKPVFAPTFDLQGVPLGGWLDGQPVIFARPPAGGRADYWRLDGRRPTNLTAALPGEPRAIGADPGVWALSAGGQVWRVTRAGAHAWGVAAAQVQSLADRPPGFRGAQNFVPPLKALALDAAAAPPALSWPGPRLPAPSPGARVTALTSAGTVQTAKDDHGVETVLLAQDGMAAKTLVTVNAALDDVAFAAPIAIRHKGLDGQDLTSWLYLPPRPADGSPPGAPSSRGPPPVVVLPYPGSAPAAPPAQQAPGALQMSVNAQILAAHGYAALVPAMPYLAGREPMEGLADQMLGPVDQAAAQGLVDAGRVAIWGHSYGGYAVLGAATQSPRFKAVVATAATSNLISAYARLAPFSYAVPEAGMTVFASSGWLETGQARMGAPPWSDPQRYLRNSPIVFADKITAPVLMFHGDNDKDVAQPQALFGALYRQNKDAVLVIYRGEGHVFYAPGNVRDYYQRLLAFLDAALAAPEPVMPAGSGRPPRQ
ncbi:hypothetical protein ASD21_15885 [Caulobacter sp. Root1455]|uniref:S9 family peptidase n=1 Tax=Caulobacter sp. Root1455 TaxID=1736465 RepID=UPI0006F4052D|nr:prolyl oligopeptidase family serine peptidase [Caulobacter sp. Root1455]KQY91789.1 hypothetical protein ASD21_15885 [Caulobacter sp. Root1455]